MPERNGARELTAQELRRLRPAGRVAVRLHVKEQTWTVEGKVVYVHEDVEAYQARYVVDCGGTSVGFTKSGACVTAGFGPLTRCMRS